MSAEISYTVIVDDYSRRKGLPVAGRDVSTEEQIAAGRRLKAEVDALQAPRVATRAFVFEALAHARTT